MCQLPFITDNAATLGKQIFQIELSNGIGFQNEHRCRENSNEISPVLTYGLLNNTDIILAFPYLFLNVYDDSGITKISGFTDLSFEIKYRIYKGSNISFAVKPGISFPTGESGLRLGSGKASGSFFFNTTYILSPITFNGNLGYMRNSNIHDDAHDIWHISLNADYSATDKLHLVANTGVEKNPDPANSSDPAFIMTGLYYFLNKDCELSTGYKHRLTVSETKHAFIFGLTLRF